MKKLLSQYIVEWFGVPSIAPDGTPNGEWSKKVTGGGRFPAKESAKIISANTRLMNFTFDTRGLAWDEVAKQLDDAGVYINGAEFDNNSSISCQIDFSTPKRGGVGVNIVFPNIKFLNDVGRMPIGAEKLGVVSYSIDFKLPDARAIVDNLNPYVKSNNSRGFSNTDMGMQNNKRNQEIFSNALDGKKIDGFDEDYMNKNKLKMQLIFGDLPTKGVYVRIPFLHFSDTNGYATFNVEIDFDGVGVAELIYPYKNLVKGRTDSWQHNGSKCISIDFTPKFVDKIIGTCLVSDTNGISPRGRLNINITKDTELVGSFGSINTNGFGVRHTLSVDESIVEKTIIKELIGEEKFLLTRPVVVGGGVYMCTPVYTHAIAPLVADNTSFGLLDSVKELDYVKIKTLGEILSNDNDKFAEEYITNAFIFAKKPISPIKFKLSGYRKIGNLFECNADKGDKHWLNSENDDKLKALYGIDYVGEIPDYSFSIIVNEESNFHSSGGTNIVLGSDDLKTIANDFKKIHQIMVQVGMKSVEIYKTIDDLVSSKDAIEISVGDVSQIGVKFKNLYDNLASLVDKPLDMIYKTTLSTGQLSTNKYKIISSMMGLHKK